MVERLFSCHGNRKKILGMNPVTMSCISEHYSPNKSIHGFHHLNGHILYY